MRGKKIAASLLALGIIAGIGTFTGTEAKAQDKKPPYYFIPEVQTM